MKENGIPNAHFGAILIQLAAIVVDKVEVVLGCHRVATAQLGLEVIRVDLKKKCIKKKHAAVWCVVVFVLT